MNIWTLSILTPVALAAVALIGYLFGRHSIRRAQARAALTRPDLERVKAIIR